MYTPFSLTQSFPLFWGFTFTCKFLRVYYRLHRVRLRILRCRSLLGELYACCGCQTPLRRLDEVWIQAGWREIQLLRQEYPNMLLDCFGALWGSSIIPIGDVWLISGSWFCWSLAVSTIVILRTLYRLAVTNKLNPTKRVHQNRLVIVNSLSTYYQFSALQIDRDIRLGVCSTKLSSCSLNIHGLWFSLKDWSWRYRSSSQGICWTRCQ